MKKIYINPVSGCRKKLEVPGDKSISHRAIITGAISKGITKVKNFLRAEDTLNTIDIFRAMGIKIEKKRNECVIYGRGLMALRRPAKQLYVGNSGTAMRLTLGVLSAQPFTSIITGDAQVSKRPMKRVIKPLTKMGAKFESNNGMAPITVYGGELKGILYKMDIASAQVKSSIIFAALHASGPTEIIEKIESRDHTERMLAYCGANIKVLNKKIKIMPGEEMKGRIIVVPGDISSAAYFMVAGLMMKKSSITIKNMGMNPTRTGIIDILKKMGGDISIKNLKEKNKEPMGDITVKTSFLKGTVIRGSMIPRLIDEIPVIAAAAAFASGRTVISGAGELRVKETDRISAVAKNLRRIGIKVDEKPDGMVIYGNGGTPFKYADIDSFGDHRIAMAFSTAALASDNGFLIKDIECVNTSFPSFFTMFNKLRIKK